MYKPISLIILLLALVACGGSGGSNSGAGAQTSNLSGHTWELCNSFSATSSQFAYIFTDTEFASTYSTYANNSCSGTPVTSDETVSGTFSASNSVATSGGFNAIEIDFHVTGAFGATLPSADQYWLYDIYYIDNDILYFGDNRTQNIAARTDTINTTDAYIQSQ